MQSLSQTSLTIINSLSILKFMCFYISKINTNNNTYLLIIYDLFSKKLSEKVLELLLWKTYNSVVYQTSPKSYRQQIVIDCTQNN